MLSLSPLKPSFITDCVPVSGARIGTAHCGIRYKDRDDLLLVVFDEPIAVAGVLTLSETASAAVLWCRNNLRKNGMARALVVTAGNSIAFTGKAGEQTTLTIAEETAALVGCLPEEVYYAATGVIGEPLDANKVLPFLSKALAQCAPENGNRAADAIRTTDTFRKTVAVQGHGVTVSGFAKGSGMIEPNMATMLGFVFTDAALPQPALQRLVSEIADTTFNSITVDGDTSTSDTLLVFATGKVPVSEQDFAPLLHEACHSLALQIVRDGEGAEKLVTITVTGAINDAAARKIGKTIANSPLVKTAIAGNDANWGRIIAAAGRAGVALDQNLLSLTIGGTPVARGGMVVPGYDETPVAAHIRGQDIQIHLDIGLGNGEATVWTCDLTHRYLDINAGYRS